MAEKNLEARHRNVGINGRLCLFYRKHQPGLMKITKQVKPKAPASTNTGNNDLAPIVDGLRELGLTNINPTQIRPIIKEIYPGGIENQDIGEVIRKVYLSTKRRDTGDNVE